MSNESAFPVVVESGPVHPGMTLRDYFAARAMQGFLSGNWEWVFGSSDDPASFAAMAKNSYAVADAMLKVREGGAS